MKHILNFIWRLICVVVVKAFPYILYIIKAALLIYFWFKITVLNTIKILWTFSFKGLHHYNKPYFKFWFQDEEQFQWYSLKDFFFDLIGTHKKADLDGNEIKKIKNLTNQPIKPLADWMN